MLAKMRAGGMACSVKLNMCDPRIVEMAGLCGLDSVWLDTEHVPNTVEQIENMVRAAKLHDVDTIVRVPRGSYSDLIKPLELDATAIMVPHVMSAEDARQVAWNTKFHPVGRRPLDGGNADGAFCMMPEDEYIRQANAERFVIAQIEDPEPIGELDAIAEVPGIDMLLFGPGDFAHGIGAVGKNPPPPEIDQARVQVAETARRHGKFAGTVGVFEDLPRLRDLGYQYVNCGGDVKALTSFFKQAAAEFAKF
jgi:4-hydroxy-2-oxoheptanedioate aldolase